MWEFMAMASVRLAELEDFFTEIKDPFDRLCRMFCEDPTTKQSVLWNIRSIYCKIFQSQDSQWQCKKKEKEEKIEKQHQEVIDEIDFSKS